MSGAAAAGLVGVQFIPGVDAVVDVALVVAAVGTAGLAAAVLLAHSHSQAKTKDSAQDKPCEACGEIPCFDLPEGGDPKELKQQLKDQEDLINSQTPDEMQERLDKADARKAKTGSYRPEGDAADREAARLKYETKQKKVLTKQYLADGMSAARAKAQAAKDVAAKMKTLDATHQLDSIVGGNREDTLGMGDSKINRSIGSQWKSRVQALKNAVKKAKAAGKKKMKIKLEPCK